MVLHKPLLVAALLVTLGSGAETSLATDIISGIPRIVDGDTLEVAAVKIRLEGIDAPESDQVCLDQQSSKWTCGIAARDWLAEHIGNRSVDCTATGSDKYGRTLAVCNLANENLNSWMVRQGWALAFTKYSKIYVTEEEQARSSQLGLWSGAFIAPWDWRHRNCKTEVLGAVSVPISAQSILCTSVDAPSPECDVKGHVTRKGERIYFLPGQLDYSRLDMTKPKPDRRWFCSEEDAEAAGYRRAAR
jgi:endonuclease YncB( thermonuclease family)